MTIHIHVHDPSEVRAWHRDGTIGISASTGDDNKLTIFPTLEQAVVVRDQLIAMRLSPEDTELDEEATP